jgi:hypothetical protein
MDPSAKTTLLNNGWSSYRDYFTDNDSRQTAW